MALTLSSSGTGGVFTLRGGSFGGRFQASVTPPLTLLLDLYPGAAAAYSLRKLRSSYTGFCIRASRSIDGNELDIGFVNNVIDTTTLLTFCGAGNGFVKTWYDQSGNGNNIFSSNNTVLIVNSGTYLGYLNFNGVTDYFQNVAGSTIWNGSQYALVTNVLAPDIATPNNPFNGGANVNVPDTGAWGGIYQTVGPTFLKWRFGTGAASNDQTYTRPVSSTALCLVNTNKSQSTETLFLNNTLVKTVTGQLTTISNTSSTSLSLALTTSLWKGYMKEVVLYRTDQTGNISGINANINAFYNIYTPQWLGNGTALLDLYPSAAAAYSLRNLSSTYLGPLVRVRRSSDNAEQDFYGLANGQLDTSSLLLFCGAGNGFVTTWYDQSGNTVNSVQTTTANQPQIVTSGAVNLQGTKPTLTFNGTTQFLTRTDAGLPVGDATYITLTRTFANPVTYYVFLSYGQASAASNVSLLYGPTLNANFQTTIGVTNYGQSLGQISRSPNLYNLQVVLKPSTNGVWYHYINNSLSTNITTLANTFLTGTFTIGNGLGYYFSGNMQETIIYSTQQTTNKVAIETNINSFYSIY